jgi:DNA-binding transcriptional LysR family regulator
MPRDEFSELRAFLEVARERSFTRAAARLGVT